MKISLFLLRSILSFRIQKVSGGETIENMAQAVLDTRAKFSNSSLADLYDPLLMPPALLKAHQALDKAVDTAYRRPPFLSERARIEYLFDLYQKYTTPLISEVEKKRKKPRKNRATA